MEASEDLVCRFIQEHEHPLGSPSQRSQWPFMRPLEDNEFDGGDEEHWYCAVCHDVGCSDYALICALGCPRVGICHRCAEMWDFDDAEAKEWTSANSTPEAALFRAVCGPADPSTESEVAEAVRKLIGGSHPDLNRTGPWAGISASVAVVPDLSSTWKFAGSSPLHAACFFGHGPAVTELIRAGAAVDARDGGQRSPLHCAAATGRDDIVRALLEAGADPMAQDVVRGLPLFYAAVRGHTAAVHALLSAAPDSASTRDNSDDAIPLHFACSRLGTADIVEMLIGAFPEGAFLPGNDRGLLPLHAAVTDGASPDIVAVLLRANRAAAMARDKEGALPLHWVGGHSQLESVRRVLEAAPEAAERLNDAGWLPLHYAAFKSAGAEIVRLVAAAYPAAASAAVKDGRLPLHIAVPEGAPLESVRVLLELNPSAAAHADENGMLPLHFVGNKTSTGVAELLLAAHPEAARTPASDGRLPLHFCVANAASAEAVAAVAAANPAAARAPDQDGNLAAHLVQANASAELVAAVLNGNPEAAATRNSAGLLPLHVVIATALGGDGVGAEDGLLALMRAHPAAALDRTEDGKLITDGDRMWYRWRRLAWRALRPGKSFQTSAADEVAQREMAVALLHPLICCEPGSTLRVKAQVTTVSEADRLQLTFIRNFGEILRDPFVRANPAALELAIELLSIVPVATMQMFEELQQEAAEARGDGASAAENTIATALVDIAIADTTSAADACSAVLILSQLCKQEQGGFDDPPTCSLLAVACRVLCRACRADHPRGWDAAAAVVDSGVSEIASVGLRSTFVKSLTAEPGVLFDLVSSTTGDAVTGLLARVKFLTAAAAADPGMAFAPLLEWWKDSPGRRKEMAELLAGDWSRLASLKSALSGGGRERGAGPAAPPDLPLSLCAILCLPGLDAASRAEWREAPTPMLVGLLLESSARRLSDVVSIGIAELLAAAGAPTGAGSAVGAAASSAASALPAVGTVAAAPRSARLEHARLYTFRLALLKLSEVVDWRAAATAAGGGSSSGASAADHPDAPLSKRVRPNPSADAGFEMLAGDAQPLRVHITVGGPVVSLWKPIVARWLSPESPFLRLFDVREQMDCTVLFRNWDDSDSPYLKSEEVSEYFLGAARFLCSLDETRDPEASLPAGLDPVKLFAMAAYMQFPALLDACSGRLDLTDTAALEMLTFYLSRAAELLPAPRAEGSSGGAGLGPRALVACAARLLRLAAEKPSGWPAHLLPDAARVCADAAADALRALTAEPLGGTATRAPPQT